MHEWHLHGRKWGWQMLAYFVYHIVGLRVPQLTVQHSLNRVFGFSLVRSTLNNLKTKASDYYLVTKRKILNRIVHGNLIHADETRANIKGHLAYVWVLTNLKEVVYILAESREGEFIQELLRGFKGVLVSDFYAAYDAIACPQQKCLIHLMRDLNEELLNNPFDEDLKSIAVGFPPRQNSCRLDMILNLGAIRMKDGSVRRSIQEQGGGAVVAAGERQCGRGGEGDWRVGADLGTMA